MRYERLRIWSHFNHSARNLILEFFLVVCDCYPNNIAMSSFSLFLALLVSTSVFLWHWDFLMQWWLTMIIGPSDSFRLQTARRVDSKKRNKNRNRKGKIMLDEQTEGMLSLHWEYKGKRKRKTRTRDSGSECAGAGGEGSAKTRVIVMQDSTTGEGKQMLQGKLESDQRGRGDRWKMS